MRAVLVLLFVLLAGCAARSTPVLSPEPAREQKYRIPSHLNDDDWICTPDGAHYRCKTVRDVKTFLWTLKA